MHDIFSINTTKLSLDESLHVEPEFRLSTGIAEAMLELQEMDMQLFKEMLAHDYKEIDMRQKGFNESSIEALHEGMWDTIKQKVSDLIDWFVKKIKSIWSAILGFFSGKPKDKIDKKIDKLKEEVKKTGKECSFDLEMNWFSDSQFMNHLNAIEKNFLALKPYPVEWVTSKPKDIRDSNAILIDVDTFYSNIGTTKDQLLERKTMNVGQLDYINSLDKCKALSNRLVELMEKCAAHSSKLQSNVDQLKSKLKAEQNNIDKQVYQSLQEYCSNVLKLSNEIKDYLAAAFAAVGTLVARLEVGDPNIEVHHNSVFLTDDFIQEASEYDFEQALESCYIDNTGTVVCNF